VNYTDRVILTIEVPENQTKEVAQQIVDQTHGDMQINWLTESIGD
jgi:putative IMPACT (imprinted ancient) family translation regulator